MASTVRAPLINSAFSKEGLEGIALVVKYSCINASTPATAPADILVPVS